MRNLNVVKLAGIALIVALALSLGVGALGARWPEHALYNQPENRGI